MISVIIPLYNKEVIIERTLRSVLSQDYDDFEVVIVDDGSTDNSLAVVQQTLELLNPLHSVNLIHQKNGGPSKARNTGVKNAQGEWIVFLDADDELLPGGLWRFADLADKYKDIEFFNCSFFVDDGNEKKQACFYKDGIVKNSFRDHALGKLIPRAGSMMVSRRLMLKHPFKEQLRRFEDLENLLKLYHESKVYNCSVPSMVLNTEYAAASNARAKINEDFMGHLSLKGRSFWEQMCVYKLFIEQREVYSKECKRLYPDFYRRCDLYLCYKLAPIINRISHGFK